MLTFFVQGDIQMSVSTLLVLGDKADGLISDEITEQWFSSYVGESSISVFEGVPFITSFTSQYGRMIVG